MEIKIHEDESNKPLVYRCSRCGETRQGSPAGLQRRNDGVYHVQGWARPDGWHQLWISDCPTVELCGGCGAKIMQLLQTRAGIGLMTAEDTDGDMIDVFILHPYGYWEQISNRDPIALRLYEGQVPPTQFLEGRLPPAWKAGRFLALVGPRDRSEWREVTKDVVINTKQALRSVPEGFRGRYEEEAKAGPREFHPILTVGKEGR